MPTLSVQAPVLLCCTSWLLAPIGEGLGPGLAGQHRCAAAGQGQVQHAWPCLPSAPASTVPEGLCCGSWDANITREQLLETASHGPSHQPRSRSRVCQAARGCQRRGVKSLVLLPRFDNAGSPRLGRRCGPILQLLQLPQPLPLPPRSRHVKLPAPGAEHDCKHRSGGAPRQQHASWPGLREHPAAVNGSKESAEGECRVHGVSRTTPPSRARLPSAPERSASALAPAWSWH